MEAFLSTHPVLWAIVLVVGSLAGVVRSWLAYRIIVRREEEHTRRVALAVMRTNGPHRAAVVRAAGQLAPVVTRRRP
ncbi:hypothetical protein GCM10009555_097940 [Acrocarpospora macrocephala]|uniref:Uncharacterized protein n=1 Tax=Acrocarpospora macrocephala TaxID=150177 RepID=A0A5M3WUR5_9ACTN|nr:hypothetical protein [Acrocarpospora macrocephala]GES12624.1 hypothetical protein Amac_062210 [Acrocarpospora macrocephala]